MCETVDLLIGKEKKALIKHSLLVFLI